MCMGCWEDYGSPRHQSPEIVAAAEAVKRINALWNNGGNLHIITEDWNLEDSNLQFCREQIDAVKAGRPPEYAETRSEVVALEDDCLTKLAALNENDRAAAMALADNYFV